MSGQVLLPPIPEAAATVGAEPASRKANRLAGASTPFRFPAYIHREEEDAAHRQAELFYLQKQIQSQTPMVIVMEDGEHVEGCIEWYDRHTLKVRGRYRMLVFKSAIKYMYKQGEMSA